MQHVSKLSFSRVMRLLTSTGNSSKASHSNMRNYFSFVKLPTLSGILFNARHLAKWSSSRATRLLTPIGNSSKASHSNMFNIFSLVKLPKLSGPFQCPTSCDIKLLQCYEVAYSNRELLQSLTFKNAQHL